MSERPYPSDTEEWRAHVDAIAARLGYTPPAWSPADDVSEEASVADAPIGAKPVMWNGTAYPSIAAAERGNGYKRGILGKWVRRGCVSDADVDAMKAAQSRGPVTWNGVTYESVTAAANANGGIAASTMWARIQNGHTCDDDVDEVKQANANSKRGDKAA